MKRLLEISLMLNAVLAVLVIWRHLHQTPLPRPLRMEISKSDSKRARPAAVSDSGAAQSPANLWSAIEDPDPRQFIARLRAIGCPEQTIRDIVTLRVCRQFRERVLTIEEEAARSRGYTHQDSRENWRERIQQRFDLRDEMLSTLESLFGEPWQKLASSVCGSPALAADPLKSFSLEARQKIRDVEAQFRHAGMDDLTQDLSSRQSDGDGRAQLRELERQKAAALAAVLSPEELEEYLYRRSPAADYVRDSLPEAKSEAEYRAMVKLALEMGMSNTLDSSGRRLPADRNSPAVREEMEQRQKAFEEALKEVLGEARVAEQKTEQSSREREAQQRETARDEQRVRDQLASVAVEVGVDPAAANRFFDRVKELQPEMNAKFSELEKSLTGTPQEKQKQLQAAAKAEMEKLAIETMGPNGPALINRMMKAESH
jgi:hypothetical protein